MQTAPITPEPSLRAAEFFAGIGLMRLGLERAGIEVVWANDIDADKHEIYAANFGGGECALGDIRDVEAAAIPRVDIATASFPCTDLSLAGNRRGLGVASAPRDTYWESSMFWEFLRVIDELGDARPHTLLLENVPGFATSNGGRDLATALRELSALGYDCEVVALNARHFVPQSRLRLFIVAGTPPLERRALPGLPTGPRSLAGHVARLPAEDPAWWDEARVRRFVDSLASVQADRLRALVAAHDTAWRTAYRRTRGGKPVWEIRADGIAGCLRTPRGGSSKQALVEAGGGEVRVRWMTAREYAALQGAPEFTLPARRNQALFGFGDAVCVPVIAWLAEHALVPLARQRSRPLARAA